MKAQYSYINVMRRAGMPLEPVGTLQQLLNGISQFGEDGFSDFEAIISKAVKHHVPRDVAYRLQDCVDLRAPCTTLEMRGYFTIEIAGVWTALLPVPAKAEAVVRSKGPARQYGRIHRMMQGDVSGPQTIVCKHGPAIREVCVFNTDGGAWTEKMEAELQTVLAALHRAA
jgi:hypothetical protein